MSKPDSPVARMREAAAAMLRDEADVMLQQRDDVRDTKMIGGRKVSDEMVRSFSYERRILAEGYLSMAESVSAIQLPEDPADAVLRAEIARLGDAFEVKISALRDALAAAKRQNADASEVRESIERNGLSNCCREDGLDPCAPYESLEIERDGLRADLAAARDALARGRKTVEIVASMPMKRFSVAIHDGWITGAQDTLAAIDAALGSVKEPAT
jgi:hypothetical protein